jgi:hypothetical protein
VTPPCRSVPEADTRRQFLKTTGLLTGLLAAGTPLALVAPGRAWALELTTFTSAEGKTLLAITRTIAPHDRLEEAAYALVVKSIDTDAAADPELHASLKEGLRQLGPGFAASAEAARVAALKAIETSPFFQTLRVKTLSTLYATPMAYAYFGYEGEAYSKGGYLLRGFNDLHWLPDVPLADSGPAPGTT